MNLCLLCLINCSEDSFSVDDDNDNVDDEINYLTHMTRYFHAKKSIKSLNVFDTTKGTMMSNDEVVKLKIDDVEPRSLE